MNKPFSLVLGILLSVGVIAQAQDTIKKTQKPVPVSVKPGIKPATTTKPATYGAYKPSPYQTPAAPVVVDNSLNGQYNAILKITYHYQQTPIVNFYRSVTDSLNVQRRKLKDAQTKLAAQAKTISSLQGDVSSKDQVLSESQAKVDTVSFLGAPVSKATYNIIMWGLVLVLGGSLVAVIFLSSSSRREAAYRIKLFDELSAEFQTYKTKANEKEKKLARELQTERNKLDELTGKG